MKIMLIALLQFSAAFWNVENYFDPFKDSLTADGPFTPYGEQHWTWKKFIAKRNALAKTLVAIDLPCVIGLAEVENYFVLRQLTQETPLSAIPYGIVHSEGLDERGIDVALLYQQEHFRLLKTQFFPLKDSDSTFLKTRDILYVKGVFNQTDTLHLMVNHWPSQRGSGRATDWKRLLARSTLIKIADSILATNPLAAIVIMGDFNQAVPSWEGMTNVSQEPTYKYQGNWSVLDQFLVSASLLPLIDTVQAVRLPFLLEKDDTHLGDKPYRTYTGPRYTGGISDHLPIRIIFTTFVGYGKPR